MHRDLGIASMKVVALLLDGLPMQPPESSERNGSNERVNLFYKCMKYLAYHAIRLTQDIIFSFRYFTLFMDLIREHFGGHTTMVSA